MQRSTARVLTALLYTEQDTMTSADLCAELSISSGRGIDRDQTPHDRTTAESADLRRAPAERPRS